MACQELASLVSAYAVAAARARTAARYMLSVRGGVTIAEYEELRTSAEQAEAVVINARRAIAEHCVVHGCAAPDATKAG